MILSLRRPAILLGAVAVLSGCVVEAPPPPPPRPVYREYVPPPPPPPQYAPPQYIPPPPPPPQYYPPPPPDAGYAPPPEALQAPAPVVSVYVDPPVGQPEPIGVPWAPPPMLIEDPGPPPFYGAYWTGGYWVWEGQWVWAHGRWLGAPQPGYLWTHPYYENRDGIVVFIPGYWRAPNVLFVAPAVGVAVVMVAARPGIVPGPRCEGPNGVFVPPPPGSRQGVIVAAPIGTSPAVVVGAPPVRQPGMRVQPGENGNFRVEAPPGATFTGRSFSGVAPGQAHLAMAQTPVVRVAAPPPASNAAIHSFSPREGLSTLPPPRPVERPVLTQPARAAQPPGERPFERAPPPPQPVAPPLQAAPPRAPQAGPPQVAAPAQPNAGQPPGPIRPQGLPAQPQVAPAQHPAAPKPPKPPKEEKEEREREHEHERR
jgi:hypothetical protein